MTPKPIEIISETNLDRRPLGSLKLSQNEMNDINIKEQRKLSLLSKEVNKWRLKATLLVEKKHYARTLEKENTKLKDRNKKLYADLEKLQGKSSLGIPRSPRRKIPSPDRYNI